jgi:hypothetical protein
MHSGRLDSPADRQLGEPVARKCMHEDGRDRQHGNDAKPPVSVAVEGQTAASRIARQSRHVWLMVDVLGIELMNYPAVGRTRTRLTGCPPSGRFS